MPPQKSTELLQTGSLVGESKRSSSSRSPKHKGRSKTPGKSHYGSEGVGDYDIFALPTSDYRILILSTFIAAIVRLFRIYQPPSVVFDEVQYVIVVRSELCI